MRVLCFDVTAVIYSVSVPLRFIFKLRLAYQRKPIKNERPLLRFFIHVERESNNRSIGTSNKMQ